MFQCEKQFLHYHHFFFTRNGTPSFAQSNLCMQRTASCQLEFIEHLHTYRQNELDLLNFFLGLSIKALITRMKRKGLLLVRVHLRRKHPCQVCIMATGFI